MDMDEEKVVAATVRHEGEQIPKERRDALRARFESAARGDISVVAEPTGSRGTRWLVAAAASVALIGSVTLLAYRGSTHRVRPTSVSSPTSDTATTFEPTTAPVVTTTPATTLPESTASTASTSASSIAPTSTSLALPPLGELPYASVDAELPTLMAASAVQVGPVGATPAWSTPWPDLPFGSDTQPTPQGWLAAYRSGSTGPWTIRFFDATGSVMRWEIRVADSKPDGSKWDKQVVAGPSNVVYVHYFSEGHQSEDAIATAGPRAGTVVATWPLPTPVGECGFPCQDNTPPTSLTTEGGTKIPFVDETGKPITTPNPWFGVAFDYRYEPGPAMPSTWVVHSNDVPVDDLASVRVTMTRHGTTWTFDALGVQTYSGGTEGFPFFSYQPALDGGYALTFNVGDHSNPTAGRHQPIVALLHGDGKVSLYRLDPAFDLSGQVMVDAAGELVVGRDHDTTSNTWRSWVRLQPNG